MSKDGRPKPVKRHFGDVARRIWIKPDAVIASIDKCNPRHARRILDGQYPVSAAVLMALNHELLRPLD